MRRSSLFSLAVLLVLIVFYVPVSVTVGPISAFLEARYIVRFSELGVTAGPLYEAGLRVSF